MRFLKKLFPEVELIETMKRQAQEHAVEYAMVKHGWHLWPEDATEDEKKRAISLYIRGEYAEWYPPGYRSGVDSSGKLQVNPDKKGTHESRT